MVKQVARRAAFIHGVARTAPGQQVLFRTGEGHVERVECVYPALQVLLFILPTEYGVAHGGFDGDGDDRQAVVGRFVRFAPQQVVTAVEAPCVLFDVPVAIRDEYRVELQSLGLVYGENPDAIHFTGRNGSTGERLVPIGQERTEVGRVVLQVGRHLVEISEQVGVFVGNTSQVEYFLKLLLKFIERKGFQFLHAVQIRFGQERFEGTGSQQVGVGFCRFSAVQGQKGQ